MSARGFTTVIHCIASGVVVCALKAHAQVLVIDDGLGFSPDPVNITLGESVTWRDDGSGPYQIISDSGAWNTFSTPGGVLFSQVGTYPYHDDFGDFGTVIVTVNIPPSVTITNPANNAVLAPPATFAFSADASDPDADGLSDVQFFVGTNQVDDVFSSPFTTTVTNLPSGTYLLSAIAYDNLGASSTNQITISVQSLPLTITAARMSSEAFQFNASGLTIGKTNVLQVSTNLASAKAWVSLATNVANAATLSFTNPASPSQGFFRLLQFR
jgi:hypothetical protein